MTKLERSIVVMLSIALALIVMPIAALVGLFFWIEAFDFAGRWRDLEPILIGFGAFGIVLWKAPILFRSVLERARLHRSGSYTSWLALAFGFSGSLLAGALTAIAILILGHTRPAGVELGGIPLVMGIAFVVFFFGGLICSRQPRL
jgi:hypothetical protein